MRKEKCRAAAAIDIGSNGVRMLIAQWDGERIQTLDYLEKTIHLGQEVFSTGFLSFDTVRQLSEILSGFCTVAREYDIVRVHAMATTALREAANQAYVLDHLRVQNHLDVDVLEDSETGVLLFNRLKNEALMDQGKVLMVYGGTGTIDFAMQQDGQVSFVHSMHTGLLKIADLLREASEHTLHLDQVAHEYLSTYFQRRNRLADIREIDGLIFSASEIRPYLNLFGVGDRENHISITRKRMQEIFEQYRSCSFEQISARLHVDSQTAGIAYAALLLVHELFQITGVKKVRCIESNLTGAAVDVMLRPGARRAYNQDLRTGAILSVQDLSVRYHCDGPHAGHVAAIAMTLFNALRKVHGMSRQHSLLLQIACILHECGHYTNAVDPLEATFDLVKHAQIYGLGTKETLLAANIIAPQSLLGVAQSAVRDSQLPEENILLVAKMHALLHLSDALDYSRRQKAVLQGIRQEENRLILTVKVGTDYTLEQLMFQQSAVVFREVFGIAPCLELVNATKMKGTV